MSRPVGDARLYNSQAENRWSSVPKTDSTSPFLGDKLVDSSHSLSLLDPLTRITKTDYRLGWPASPRDTITISRTFVSPDSSSLIDLSTSLPRAADEPAFLRPAPPFVRANVHLMAWCVQVLPPVAASSPPLGSTLSTSPSSVASTSPFPQQQNQQQHRLRLTLFWQWSLRLPTSLSTSSSSTSSPTTTHIAPLLSSFVNYLRSPLATGMPLVRGYGRGVGLNRDEWDVQAETRSVEYAVVYVGGSESPGGREDEDDDEAVGGNLQGLDELVRRRERIRLERSVELSLPPLGTLVDPVDTGAGTADGWDVRVVAKSLGGPASTASTPLDGPTLSDPSDPPYTLSLTAPTAPSSSRSPRLTLRLSHPPLRSPSHLLRVILTVQRLAAGRGVRVNGEKKEIECVEARNPTGMGGRGKGWELAADGSTTDEGASSIASEAESTVDHEEEGTPPAPGESSVSIRTTSAASPSTQIASLLRRSYIYFLSLLQEPPAKWRHISDSQGVTVTQLLSPDPTLTIYRAEAVFVGVGVWDVFATVVTPGVRKTWDKSLEEAVLVADEENGGGVGELSEVWWERRKGQWPVACVSRAVSHSQERYRLTRRALAARATRSSSGQRTSRPRLSTSSPPRPTTPLSSRRFLQPPSARSARRPTCTAGRSKLSRPPRRKSRSSTSPTRKAGAARARGRPAHSSRPLRASGITRYETARRRS